MLNKELKYYSIAGALGLGWLAALLLVPTTRDVLIGNRDNYNSIALNALLLVLTGLIVAWVFRRFITSARSWKGDLLRAVVLPYAGCLIYLTLLILTSWAEGLLAGRGFHWHLLALYYWGFLFALAAFLVVIPYGLLCQYVMRRVAT